MKKGFTLVELLSVIVILAVISLIATPALVNVIESSKRNAKESSAKGYINSVNDQIVSNEFDEETTTIKDGTYYTSLLKEVYKLDVTGEEPIEDSWVTISNATVTDYSLKFDTYVVDSTKDTAKGDIRTHDMCMIMHAKRKGTKTLGDSYGCEMGDGSIRQFFYLSDDESTITLIAAKNVGNDEVAFSNVNSKLDSLTTDWDVDASIPTIEQISKDNIVYTFITKKLEEEDKFWTTTDIVSNTSSIGHIAAGSNTAGIRPIIIIDK